MGDIVVTEFITVDGVAEDPGGSEGHPHGGWGFETVRGKGAQFKLDEIRATDALLLGRRTYDGFAQAWPGQEGEFADKFNSIPKYVVSSTLKEPSWTNTTVLQGDLAEEVEKLRQRHEGDIGVHGSLQLAQALLDRGLVDELRLMIFPVVLGSGKRLFSSDASHRPLELAESRNVGDGVVILTYHKA
jgi:dihydrofolate reductase